jgi:Protein of unknown function (DUF4232)
MRLGLVGVAVLLAMAGCHSTRPATTSSPSAAPPSSTSPVIASSALPSPGATASASAGTTRCHTGGLSGHVEGHGEGAGQRYAFLGLTNTGSSACTVYGYPGLQLVGPSGAALPTTAQRDTAQSPALLTVQPGQTVWATLHWTVVPADDEASGMCAPNPTGLRVIPPDETTQLSMAFDYGPVCQHGTINVGSFRTERPPNG